MAKTKRIADDMPRHVGVDVKQQLQPLFFYIVGQHHGKIIQDLIEVNGPLLQRHFSCLDLADIE